jgi:iron only hydrogenase large subunit-like protein
MNDYLAPNQACIAPLLKPKKGAAAAAGADESAAAAGGATGVAGKNTGTRVRVEMELSASDASDLRFPGLAATGGAASSIAAVPAGAAAVPVGHFDQIKSDPLKKTASVSLNDCLACSGCVTSAETVLITQQSTQEFLNVLEANEALRAAAAATASGAAAATAAGDSATAIVAPADAMADVSSDASSSSSLPLQPRVVVVSISPQSLTALAHEFGLSLLSCARKLNTFFTKVMHCDAFLDTSPALDVALIEAREEFIARYKDSQRKLGGGGAAAAGAMASVNSDNTVVPSAGSPLPVLTSECPGWVCYAEKTQGLEVLSHLSSVKSPQAILASWLKRHWAAQQNPPVHPAHLYHVTVMPCYDKKLEVS